MTSRPPSWRPLAALLAAAGATHLAVPRLYEPSRFPTAATGHGNPYLARALGEAAVAAAKTDTFLGERYRRIARRRGKKKTIVAVGRSILIIVWHLLSDPAVDFVDLGHDFYDTRGGTQCAIRYQVRRLEAVGYQVTLHPAA